MPSNYGTNGNQRIEALRKRQAALREQMARELVRQQKKNERDDAKLHAVIGATLARNISEHPELEVMVKAILKSTNTFSDSEKKLLLSKGWM